MIQSVADLTKVTVTKAGDKLQVKFEDQVLDFGFGECPAGARELLLMTVAEDVVEKAIAANLVDTSLKEVFILDLAVKINALLPPVEKADTKEIEISGKVAIFLVLLLVVFLACTKKGQNATAVLTKLKDTLESAQKDAA